MINRLFKILVVDDHQDRLDELRSLLINVFPNVIVLAARTCQQALDFAASEDCEMILLDSDLFAADNGEICRKLREMEITRNIPLVLLIPRDMDKQSRILAIKCGIDVFLSKPLDDCELEAQVRAILKYKKLSDEKSETAKASADFASRFHSLFENISSGVAIFKVINDGSSGKDYIFADCNAAALKMERLEKTKIIGKSLYDVRPNADLGFAMKYFKKVWETGEAVEFETKVKIDATHFAWYETKVIKLASGEIATFYDNVSETMISNEQLMESEKKYRTIAENMTDVIWTTDMSLHTTYISPSVEKLIGVSPETYMSWPLEDRFTPQSLTSLMQLYKTEMELEKSPYQSDRRINTIDTELYRKNREIVWVSMNLTFLRDENKKAIGILGITRDITERKEAEKELILSESKFKHVFDYSAIGKSLTLPNGELQVNHKLCEMLGYTEEELIGKKWQDVSDPADFEVTQIAMDNLVFGRKSTEQFEKRYIKKDGSILWGEVHSSIRRDAEGIPLYFMTSVIDITERKKNEEAIRKQNELFTTLLRLLPVGVFMVDAPSGRPLIANEAALHLLGRGILPDTNKHNLSHIYRARKRDTTQEYPPEEMPIILGMSGIESHIDDMVVERPDGSETLLEIFGTPVRNEKGDVWASLVTFLDITKRKNAEENLVYISYHDFLTGLYNRRFFEEELKRLDTERNLPITIVMADLNGLKLINDSFGHATGDELLKQAARVITEAFRSDDLVSRIGGDEYAIMLVKTDHAEAAQIIQRLNVRIANENTGVLDLSISFGYHTKTNKNENILKVMENAENHMYRQKFFERDSVRSKTVEIIMNTLFEKSRREMMHSKRVSEICEAIATEMHLEKANINKIRTAGLVHDIGKIGISENILNKPKKLNEVEWDEIKKHPESGWRILISVKEFSEIADFVLGHHEHWDGSGYPNGLVGDQISLEARIIALADAYDAMTVDRTYRKGLTPQEAITEIKRCSGTQFDPELAHLFISKVVKNLKKRV
jgi:diguanylate cyclase (GGDEF)-like protein/PAS domain S-box-containing protein/putative nucleotidyltransferase with HDIG domain